MTQDKDMNGIFESAFTSALITGIGVVKISNTNSGMEWEAVAPDKFLELSEELKWRDQKRFKGDKND